MTLNRKNSLRNAKYHSPRRALATVNPADVPAGVVGMGLMRTGIAACLLFAGPFRYMDLTGVPAYATVMRDLLPELSNETTVPGLIANLVASGARGVSNARGFYRYTKKEARRWEKRFLEFSYEIRALAKRYAETA